MSNRIERQTLNAQTLRVDADGDGVKISIMKGTHYRGIAKLSLGDAADITKFLHEFLHGESA